MVRFMRAACVSGLFASSHLNKKVRGLNLLSPRFSMTASTAAATDPNGGTVSSSFRSAAVHVYPYQTKIDSKQFEGRKYSKFKTVHWLRHAEGSHNVNKEYRSPANLDARITTTGAEQCRSLSNRIVNAAEDRTISEPLHDLYHNAKLVITSPLTRCIQTSLLCLDRVFANRNVPIVAHEGIRETVNFNCDRRRPISEIAAEFPIDFSHLEHSHDHIWELYARRLGDQESYPYHRESAEIYKVAERGRTFFEWLGRQPHDHIIVCSHAAVSRCIWNFGLPGHVPYLPEQLFDERQHGPSGIVETPLVEYAGNDETFEKSMRSDYDNCEIRSMILAFVEDI
jgi:broad specificity phosphatase PhoE